MVTAPDISCRQETRVVDRLMVYLLGGDGKDVLEFRDNDAARGAADALRARSPRVSVEARYNKVFLKIKETP